MNRKAFLPFAALLAAGAVLLSACDNGISGAPAPSSSDAPSAAAAASGATDAALNLLRGTAMTNNAKAKSGDWATGPDGTANTAKASVAQRWVQLTASQAGQLNPVVVNGAGFTLYRFDKDTPNPSKSNCDGDCAVTWPPVTVARGGKIFISGVDKSAVGVVQRTDGQLQVTIGGWPVYRFSKDNKPGDTNGQGVGGTWFGVTPDGKKAGGGATGATGGTGGDDATPPPATTTDQGQKASSAILFDDANFSDNGASQGVSGPGCQNLARPNLTSSVRADGSLKLWSEKDCTGQSIVIPGDTADLAALNFDDTVASVFLG